MDEKEDRKREGCNEDIPMRIQDSGGNQIQKEYSQLDNRPRQAIDDAWSESEHRKFVECVGKYGHLLENFENDIYTKTRPEIEKYAKKFFGMLENQARVGIQGNTIQEQTQLNQKNGNLINHGAKPDSEQNKKLFGTESINQNRKSSKKLKEEI